MKTPTDINDPLVGRASGLPGGNRPAFVLHTFGEGGLTPEAEAKGLQGVILDSYQYDAPRDPA